MFPENCNRCGLCCAQAVRVSKKEIARIKKSVCDRVFLEKEPDGRCIIKQINGFCIFFSIRAGEPHCGIYKHRPNRCKDFPSAQRCTFGNHPIFRISEAYKNLKKELEQQTGLKAPTK